jgi:D-serine deaminase-like pyridoxal phosphate-dependent protein
MQLMLDAGITKFKCATIAEAELLGSLKAPDVLLAYQPVGPKVERLLKLVEVFPDTKFSCLIDNFGSAENIGRVFSALEKEIEVYIDINAGMNRSGIKTAFAFGLYQECYNIPGIIIKGLHLYDGHFRQVEFSDRKGACDANFEQLTELANKIKDSGFPKPIIVAGGSPTFPIHAQREFVECSPGTFVFWDKTYGDICKEQPFIPAAIVVSRVISLPDDGKICIDLGHKSIAAENEISKRAYFLNAPELKLISQSEEHGVVDAGLDHHYKPGDVFYILPFHVCPTVALFNQMQVIKLSGEMDKWEVSARDRRINY